VGKSIENFPRIAQLRELENSPSRIKKAGTVKCTLRYHIIHFSLAKVVK
jgi:hypothetical protein